MNEETLRKLKVIVERAVRPVRASIARKKKMREELVAHVTGVYEEQLSASGNEISALSQTAMRFGDPNELACNLQGTVPVTDSIVCFAERLLQPRPAESLIRLAGRYGMMVFTCSGIVSIFFSPLLFFYPERRVGIGVFAYILLLIGVCFGALTSVATLLADGIQQALFSPKERSFPRAFVLGILSFIFPFLGPPFVFLGIYPVLSRDLIVGFFWSPGILPGVAGLPLVLILAANSLRAEQKYAEEWAKLEID